MAATKPLSGRRAAIASPESLTPDKNPRAGKRGRAAVTKSPAVEVAQAAPLLVPAALRANADYFKDVFRSPPAEKIAVIRQGMPANVVGELSSMLKVSKDSLIDTLGMSRATVHRKSKENKPLASDESERVLGIQALIGQVQTMVEQSGDPAGFNAAEWVAGWLNSPLSALGGNTPASYMDTVEGQKYVANLLTMSQSGAYA